MISTVMARCAPIEGLALRPPVLAPRRESPPGKRRKHR